MTATRQTIENVIDEAKRLGVQKATIFRCRAVIGHIQAETPTSCPFTEEQRVRGVARCTFCRTLFNRPKDEINFCGCAMIERGLITLEHAIETLQAIALGLEETQNDLR